MPTLIPSNEKQAFIALVQAAPIPGGAFEASRLQDVLVYYSDVYTAIMRELELFGTNNAYLIQGLSCFNQQQLQDVGIWFNVTITSPPLTNPILIANCTLTYNPVLLANSSPPSFPYLCILGTSNISGIALEASVNIIEIYIGPGVIVDIVDASQPGAVINQITLPNIKSMPATLNAAVYGSQINFFDIDEGSYFGGYTNVNPDSGCGSAVANIEATEITNNSILLSWTPPSSQSPPEAYLFINVAYRKANSVPWIPATLADGDFINDAGFIFRYLEKDTYYDFQIGVVCTNGGINNQVVTAQTSCCGTGSKIPLTTVCPITFLISDTMDSPPLGQLLCNGVSIALHYPPGPAITIPYFATVNAVPLNDFLVDNVPYQLMPYSGGTFDASGTSLGSFVDGNVITVSVSLPL